MQLNENQKVFKEGLMYIPADDTEKPHLIASKCPKCGKVYFPQKDFCPTCMVEDLPEISLDSEAVLYTFTIVSMGVRGFKTPYVLGWVDIPKDGVRIAAQILCDPDTAAEKLHSGTKLRLDIGVLRTMEDGTESVGYRFVPVED